MQTYTAYTYFGEPVVKSNAVSKGDHNNNNNNNFIEARLQDIQLANNKIQIAW